MKIKGQENIASVFGVAPKTIVEWQEQGFPIYSQGKRGVSSEYETLDCITWFVQREMDKVKFEAAKDRLSRLQGDKVELELATMRRDLVPSADVEPAIAEFLIDLRNEFDQIADKYTDPICASARESVAVHNILKQAALALKNFCSNYAYRSATGQEDAEAGV